MTRLLLLASLLLALVPSSRADSNHRDRASLFSTINISEDETAGDVACAFCTVNIQGDVSGDVAVLFGTVNVQPSRTISGDVALLFGTLRLDEDTTIRGALASLFSTAEIAPTANIRGSHAVVPKGLALGVILAPLLILLGIAWLVVHLVRRNRSPYRV